MKIRYSKANCISVQLLDGYIKQLLVVLIAIERKEQKGSKGTKIENNFSKNAYKNQGK